MTASFRSCGLLAAFAGATLFLGGCLQERLAWSPDGSHATVITADGLYLTDAAGQLSGLLVPRAYRAAWLGDSRRAVIARSREIKDLAALTTALGPERSRALAIKAESIWQLLQTDKSIRELPSIKPDDDVGAIVIYLRERHRDGLRAKVGEDWKDVESTPVEWHSLVVARLEGDRLEIGATLYEGLARVHEIRPAPGGSAVAFVTHLELNPEADERLQILLAPSDGSTPATLVTQGIAAFPDWSSDRRTLVCFKSEGRGTGSGDLRLGTLTGFVALEADGNIATEKKSADLAGLIFHESNRVRCLRDGRVLFNAAPFSLPIAAKDQETREEFFVADVKEATVTRLFPRGALAALPKSLAHFELSPDEKQILVSDDDGKVWLLTIGETQIEKISAGFGKEDSIAPAWRKPGEFAYRKKAGTRAELVLRRGPEETVLSRTWPDDVLQRLIK